MTWRGRRLRVQWSHEDAWMPPHDAFRFRLGERTGALALDRPAQIALLGEPRLEALPHELRTILLADAAHEIVEALMRATRKTFEWLPGAAAPPVAGGPAVFFRVHAGDDALSADDAWRGSVCFDDPAALAEFAPPRMATAPAGTAQPGAADPLAALRLPLPWRIGTTRIALREVRRIVAGDLVGVEDWRSAGAAIVAEAELGARRLVALAEGSRITIQQTKDLTMNRHPDPTSPAGDAQDAASPMLDRLDALEVTLRFEVGELEVSLGELRNLRAGHVFELGQPLNRCAVRILAHGNVLGKGHLVAVGERLGVRVSEFAAGEI